MNKDELAYCGLSCTRCKSKFAEVRNKMNELDIVFKKVNMQEMARVIPFMNSKYKGYKKLVSFFSQECPSCRNKGGNPFCGIRKCALKKKYATCAECSTGFCSKFKPLFKIHDDGEIQNTIKKLKEQICPQKK